MVYTVVEHIYYFELLRLSAYYIPLTYLEANSSMLRDTSVIIIIR